MQPKFALKLFGVVATKFDTILEVGEGIVKLTAKFGAKTKEAIGDLANFIKQVAGNETGAIGNITKKIESTGDLASNPMMRENLFKQLASESQMKEAGSILAGRGSSTVFRGAEEAASKYGGNAADYVKKSSSSIKTPDGYQIETHWVENLSTGARYEHKTKIIRN